MTESVDNADRIGPVVTLVALVMVAAAVTLLHIEESLGLPRLMPLVVVGFVIHALLPLKFRMWFFLLLGVVGSVLVFGPMGSAMLFGAGLTLLCACHLPIPYKARVGVVLSMTAGLATLRVGWVEVPGANAVLPILASMFMFRLMIYLYDLPHERKPVPIQTRLAYFFMLPNLCFPLFPVVDFQRFISGHYVIEADTIHRKGVAWMLLGVTHVLAYRVVSLYLVPDAAAVENPEHVALYMLSGYLQYLRISGMFHIAVGMLCLFGFNLPATNKWFFFASSYTELWRRINIYWKDFLQKTIYFPVFMRYRKKQGMERGLVLATIAVFVVSWALHSWQWFWLQGEVLFTEVDLLFWGLAGAAVVVSAVVETRRGNVPSPPPLPPLQEAIARTRGTALVFGLTCVLWSLWCSGSVQEWFAILGHVWNGTPAMWARICGVIVAVLAAGVGLSWLDIQGRLPDFDSLLRRAPALIGAGSALLLLGMSAPEFPDDTSMLALTAESTDGPVGYYEGLIGSEETGQQVAAAWDEQPMFELSDDLRRHKLKASTTGILEGRPFQSNEHGMRDDSVSVDRTPGVVRVALMGASPEMGFRVASGEEFPALMDEDFGPSVEILNFAVAAYSPVENVVHLDLALAFDPDVVLFAAHCDGDRLLTGALLRKRVEKGQALPPALQRIAEDALSQEDDEASLEVINQATRLAYRRMATAARRHGAVPLWVYIPLPTSEEPCGPPSPDDLEGWAGNAGFDTLRLEAVYGQGDPTRFAMDKRGHPTPEAHRMIADKLTPALAPWIAGIREE